MKIKPKKLVTKSIKQNNMLSIANFCNSVKGNSKATTQQRLACIGYKNVKPKIKKMKSKSKTKMKSMYN
jgi:hypothetical protein